MAAIAGRSIEKAIAQEAYFDDLSPSKRESLAQTTGLFPDALQDSEIGGIPEGWEVRPVSDVVQEVYDGPHATPKKSDIGNVFLGIKNLTGTQLDLANVRRIHDDDWPKWTKRVEPQHLDIVFSYEATLGFFALIPEGLKCCLGRRLALVRADGGASSAHYLYHWFTAPTFQEHIRTHTVHGATVDRIPLKDFPQYPCLMPSSEILNRFETIA